MCTQNRLYLIFITSIYNLTIIISYITSPSYISLHAVNQTCPDCGVNEVCNCNTGFQCDCDYGYERDSNGYCVGKLRGTMNRTIYRARIQYNITRALAFSFEGEI